MTSRIRHRSPRLRWYLQLARLHVARALALPAVELWGRGVLVFIALSMLALLVWDTVNPMPVARLPNGEPVAVQAAINFVIQIALLIASALISAALTPKPKPPEAIKASVPVVDDGKGIERLYGSCWFDDSIFLGFKQMGTSKIRAKGGKKG